MTTEDYVSFETAKLLKEKGFDVWGDGSFGTATKIWKEYGPSNGKLYDCSMGSPSRKAFPAPTLQMTMKWMREAHNIILNIFYCDNAWCSEYYGKDDSTIIGSDYETYEEACESGIKYALENLI